jgi:hypothetical protein
VILRLGGGFDELRDYMGRSRQVGIAHAEIHNVLTPVPRFHLHTVDDAENVGWQSLDPLKFHAPLP